MIHNVYRGAEPVFSHTMTSCDGCKKIIRLGEWNPLQVPFTLTITLQRNTNQGPSRHSEHVATVAIQLCDGCAGPTQDQMREKAGPVWEALLDTLEERIPEYKGMK